MRRMDEDKFKLLLKADLYQVFLFSCPATLPYSFASHPWFVVNKKGTVSRWEIFWRPWFGHIFRWGYLHKDFYTPTQGVEMFFLSEKHFWGPGTLRGYVEGGEGSMAQRMAAFIENSGETYPHCQTYSLLGPNSNTYIQWVLDHFPESKLGLPWNSFGKKKVSTC